MSRAELEDRFLRLHDETLLVKQYANEQGEKLKRTTTKLRRLTNEKKKPEQVSSGPARLHEAVKLDATIKHFQERINELEEQNASLQNKLKATQQAQFQSRSPCREILLDHLKKKGKEVEESTRRLKEQETTSYRLNIRDNVKMIKIRKQLLEKSNALSEMEDKFRQLQENHRNLRMNHAVLAAENDELNLKLKEEQLKCLNLEKKLQSVTVSNQRPEELQERIKVLGKENELLRESYDRLYNIVFSMTRQKDWLLKVKQLKEQIDNLQTDTKSTFAKKNEIIDKLKAERDQNKKLMEENEDLKLRYLEQKQQLEELKSQVKLLTKEGDTDVAKLSEALLLTKAIEKIIIEILSLSLTEPRITSDETIKQLFVECKLHDVIAEKTPLSLPKPKIDERIYYNFGCVIHVDKANNSARRDYLKSMLLEPDLHIDRLKFAVISDPLACGQDLECRDIGFAYVSLREIFQEGKDIIEQDIDLFDSQDATAVIGKLKVSVEALRVLRSVHEGCTYD
ncbi:protein fantom [Pterocles gutturalis]